MQPMSVCLKKGRLIRKKWLNFADIKEALENTQRYLLDGNQLLFERNFSFSYADTEWNLCYLPTYDGNMTESFRKLSEYC